MKRVEKVEHIPTLNSDCLPFSYADAPGAFDGSPTEISIDRLNGRVQIQVSHVVFRQLSLAHPNLPRSGLCLRLG